MNRASKLKVQRSASPSIRSSNRTNVLHEHLIPSRTTNSSDPTTVPQHRFKRAPPPPVDKLGEFATHMQLTARIVNGISLQNGLIGTNATTSITANDVMTELLRMGSLSPDVLIAIKPGDVQTVMKAMKELPGKLSNDNAAQALENEYADVRTIMDTNVNFTDFKDVKTKSDTYKINFDALKPSITDTDIENPVANVNSLITGLDDLLVFLRTGDTSDTDEAVSKVSLYYKVRDAETLLKNYVSVGELVASLKKLQKDYSFIETLQNESEAREKLTDTKTQTTAEGQITKNINEFDAAAKELAKLEAVLIQIQTFAKSRQSIQPTAMKYTAGLPSGITDLENLSADIGDTWFQKSVNGTQQLSQNLKKGLLPLDSFKTSVKGVQTTWNSVQKNIKSAETVLSLQLKIAGHTKTGKLLHDGIAAYKNCRKTFAKAKSNTIKDIESQITPISDFNSKLDRLKGYDHKALMTRIDDLQKRVDFRKKSDVDKKKTATEIINDFKANKLSVVTDTLATLKILVGNVEPLKEVLKVFSDKSKITGAFSHITDYYDDAKDSKFEEQVNCLQKDVAGKADLMKSTIESIQELRAIKSTNTIAEAEEFANGVVKSAGDLEKAKASVSDMKNVTDIETKSLNMLSGSMQISQNLANAAQGITKMSKAEKILNKLAPLTGDVQYIQDSANKHKNTLGDHFPHLQSIGKLNTEMKALLGVLDNVKKSFDNFNATSLADNGPIFKAAEPIKSVTNIDFVKVNAAVVELKKQEPSIAAKLDDVRDALDDLEKLDLDFANSKFSIVPNDMKTLDLFFAEYGQTTTATHAPIILGGPGGGPGVSPKKILVHGTPAPVAAAASDPTVVIAATIGGIAFAAAIGGVAFFLRRRHNKPKQVDLLLVFHFPQEVVEKIEKECEERYKTSNQFYEDAFNVCQMISKVDVTAINPKHLPKHRYNDIYLINSTAVKLPEMPAEATEKGDKGEKPFIHASVMRMADETEWIMAQGPLDGNENFKPPKVSTLETHWWMIEQKDVALNIQLCQFIEKNRLKCAMYYPEKEGNTMKVGMYTLTCLKNKELDAELFFDHTGYTLLTIQYERKGVKKTTDILRYINWPDMSAPSNPDVVADMVLFADTYAKKNVLVHCSAGIGRTGTVVGAKKGVEMCMSGQKPGLNQILAAMRECRYNALQRPIQIAAMVLGITRILIRTTNNKMFVPAYPALKYYYSHWDTYTMIDQPKRTPDGEPLVDKKTNQIEYVLKVEQKSAEKKSTEAGKAKKVEEEKKDEKKDEKGDANSGSGSGTEKAVVKDGIQYEQAYEFLYPRDAQADIQAQHEAVAAAKTEWEKNKKEAKKTQEADKKGGNKKGKKGKKGKGKGKKSGEKTKTKSGGSTGTSVSKSVEKSAQSQTGSKMTSKQE